jgi:hypothetical protein
MLPQFLTALFAAILGGFIAHLLTTQRDRANTRRAKRVDYLIEADGRLEACAQRRWSKKDSIAAAEFQAMSIHPRIIEKDGRKEFVILPYEEFLRIEEELEDYHDLRMLREEKASAGAEPTRSLDEALKDLGE